MSDIFISYARVERQRAEVLCQLLRSEGFKVFLDVDGLEVGDFFPDILDREVKAATVVLGLWTPTSLTRPWVKIECDIAKMRNVLVPLMMTNIEPMDIPANFWGLQTLDFTGFDGTSAHPAWRDLLRRLRDRVRFNVGTPSTVGATANETGRAPDSAGISTPAIFADTALGDARWVRVKRENDPRWEIIKRDIQWRIEFHPVFSKSFYKYVVETRMHGDALIGDVHIDELNNPKRFRIDIMVGRAGVPGYQMLLSSDQMKLEPIQVRWMEERSAGLVLRRTDGVEGVYSVDTFADEVCRAIAKYLGQRKM